MNDMKSTNLPMFLPYIIKGFARGSSHSVLLTFSQSYVKHNLKKKKIVILFFG
jgi:hypothetical protein